MTDFHADWERLARILTTDDVTAGFSLVENLQVLSGAEVQVGRGGALADDSARSTAKVQCYATLNTWVPQAQDDGNGPKRAEFLLAFGAGAGAWRELLDVLSEVSARFDMLRWDATPAAVEVVETLGLHQTVVVVTP